MLGHLEHSSDLTQSFFSHLKSCLQSNLTPFKHFPSRLHSVQTLQCFTLSTQICIAYILLAHKGPNTNSPSLSVKLDRTLRITNKLIERVTIHLQYLIIHN